jgi:hypothetical protein
MNYANRDNEKLSVQRLFGGKLSLGQLTKAQSLNGS